MPPLLALSLTLFFIGYLLRRDAKEDPTGSSAIWIPTIWLMINGSRQVSLWFDTASSFSAQRLEDGSPIDKAVYGLLMVAGLYVLARRRVRVAEIVRNNIWITLFLLYEGLSVVWSDFPLVAFKRWGKALGDPVMVLVLCTDPFPARAITAAIKRSAYVLLPLSVLFCKYYENWGRSFDQWGMAAYTGVTTNKNLLGYLLFTFGLFFVAALISRPTQHSDDRSRGRYAQAINVMFLIMIGWLFAIADCQTAVLALAVGIAVIVVSRFAAVRRHFGLYALAAILLVSVLEVLFSLSGNLVESSGRDMTFTGRTGLWETLLQEPVNPLIGVGYASFWLGERLLRFWAMYPASPPTEAHNGYLEVYLNLGLIGLCLLAGVLWAGLSKTRSKVVFSMSASETSNDRTIRNFGIAYVIAYLFYNVTEATFQGLNFLFIIFLILAFNYAKRQEPARNLRYALATQRRRRSIERRAAVHAS